MNRRQVGITPRLSAALDLLNGSETVADVGSDHGKLAAALLQRGVCSRVVASDISEQSLQKGIELIRHIGLEEKVDFRVGDGLQVLAPGECDTIALLGMGGTLMCEILDTCDVPLMGAKAVVLQPMRAQRDIRSYLYRHDYRITDDRVIVDHGRYYQIFRAVPDTKRQELPESFPKDFFDVGFVSFEQHDPNLPALCRLQLSEHGKQMRNAKGTEGEEKLRVRMEALNAILAAYHGG